MRPEIAKFVRAIEFSQHKNVDKRQRSIFLLAELRGEEISRVLIPLLSDSSSWVRYLAADSLRGYGGDGVRSALRVRFYVEDDPNVRFAIVAALRSIPFSSAFRLFMHALRDESADVVSEACAALGELKNPRATPAIKRLLSSKSWQMRLDACISLIMLGCKDQRILSRIEQLMNEPDAAKHDEAVKEVKTECEKSRIGGLVLEHGYLAQRLMAHIYTEAKLLLA